MVLSQKSRKVLCPHENCGKTVKRDHLKLHLTTHDPKRTKLPCASCGKQFASKESLDHHKDTQHSSKPRKEYPCPDCPRLYKSTVGLREHKERIHSDAPLVKRHECPQCSKMFQTIGELNRHMKRHNGYRPYYCRICGAGCHSASNLRIHEETHNSSRQRNFHCTLCPSSFCGASNLSAHIKRVHENIRNHPCDQCGKKFGTESDLARHSIRHNGIKQFHCDYKTCEYSSFTSPELKKHKKTHLHDPRKIELAPGWETGDKIFRFQCVFCPENRQFKLKASLLRHITLRHTNERHFNCVQCKKTFKLKQSLLEHQAKHLPKEEREQYKCKSCNYTALVRSSFYDHVKSQHQKLRPFSCSKCSKSFLKRQALTNHFTSIHTDHKGFKCLQCGAEFKLDVQLKSHQVIHKAKEDRQLFPCEVDGCKKTFIRKAKMRLHMKYHDGVDCKICGKGFLVKANLDVHVTRVHVGSREFQCESCPSTSFNTRPESKRHVNEVHNRVGKVYCSICMKVLGSQRSLNTHLITHLDPSERTKYECSHCPQKFLFKKSLNSHVASVHKDGPILRMKCPRCPKTYKEGHGLSSHVKFVHLKAAKTQKCMFCGNAFKSRGELYSHIRSHTGEKPYLCTICGRGCQTGGTLEIHMETHNTNRQRKFQCTFCPRMYYAKCNMKEHIKVYHLQGGSAPCYFCSKRLRCNGESMVRHIAMHTMETPFKCAKCEYRCASSNNLAAHVRTHYRTGKFQCYFCKLNFNGKVLNHMKKHLNEVTLPVGKFR